MCDGHLKCEVLSGLFLYLIYGGFKVNETMIKSWLNEMNCECFKAKFKVMGLINVCNGYKLMIN